MNTDELYEAISDLKVAQGKTDERLNSLEMQMKETKAINENVQKLALAMERQTGLVENMSGQICQVRKDVEEIKTVPSKRWDLVVGIVLTAVITAVIAYFIK